MGMAETHREAFRDEALELLSELESALLELEYRPDEQELIGRTFRAMHTIKGSGGMFGFTEISDFTHEVETVFDLVRSGAVAVDKELIDLTLRSCDLIRAMLEGDGSADAETRRKLTALFRDIARPGEPASLPSEDSAPATEGGSAAGGDVERVYRIRFIPSRDILKTGTDPALLLDELRQLGSCTVIAHPERIPRLDELEPEDCHTFWDVLLTTNRGINAIRDVFIFVEDDGELHIDVLDTHVSLSEGSTGKKLGEILVERGDLSSEDIHKALSFQRRLGELLVEKGMASPAQVESALVEQRHVREVQQRRQSNEAAASIRVSSERLDKLVNLVGELVTVQARLSMTADHRCDPQLTLLAEEVERLTAELRDSTLTLRMMPIGGCFSRFTRLVRDLSGELGKNVELVTCGGETELDKTVLERLNDPLVHIIRNSIDHGIETPDVRLAGGKPAQGTVRLTAEHSGDSVTITIEDDGAGLDGDAIRAKAVDRGLLNPSAASCDKELFSLIFAPGFSTAKTVTGVSGRGVGMDVVKRAIDSLRGSIDISSRRGIGTVITIRLPLTLAIIETLLVKAAGESYVMPLSLVEECIELNRVDAVPSSGNRLVNVRGGIVPYVSLRDSFNLGGAAPDIEQIVITNLSGNRFGIVVDSVVGEHQTVIKTLGRVYRNVEGISGATILGDGDIALILDIPALMGGTGPQ